MKGNDAAKRVTTAISNTLFFWRRWSEPGRESAGRKQMREMFEASGTTLRSLIQNVSDVIIILEADGTVRYDSPAVESVLGYRPGERVGTSGFGYVHPEDLERVRDTFVEALSKPGVQPPIEFRVRHKDGSWRHVKTTRA